MGFNSAFKELSDIIDEQGSKLRVCINHTSASVLTIRAIWAYVHHLVTLHDIFHGYEVAAVHN